MQVGMVLPVRVYETGSSPACDTLSIFIRKKTRDV